MIWVIVLKIILGFVFLKSSITKIKKPYQFYRAIMDYGFKKERIFIYLVPLLIALEFGLAITLIVPISPVFFLLSGIVLQIFYITLIFMNMNKVFKDNCDCFPLNAPGEITTRNLATNLSLLIFIIITYSNMT